MAWSCVPAIVNAEQIAVGQQHAPAGDLRAHHIRPELDVDPVDGLEAEVPVAGLEHEPHAGGVGGAQRLEHGNEERVLRLLRAAPRVEEVAQEHQRARPPRP